MNLIAWNCNMAFRNKWEVLIPFHPDLMIISECECGEKFPAERQIPTANDYIWIGDNLNKGISIISCNGYRIRLSKNYNERFRYIVPIEVTGPASYTLFAIWAMPHKKSKVKSYVGQIWGALNYYSDMLTEKCLLVGDFNSNAFWDFERKSGNHSDVVRLLAAKNIKSLYHYKSGEEQGAESSPTLFY